MKNPYKAMADCHVCCAWIAPDGKATHLSDEPGMTTHSSVARHALGSKNGGWELDDAGYVHMSYGATYMGPDKEPTQAQLDTLFDIQTELERREMYVSVYVERFIQKQQEKVTA